MPAATAPAAWARATGESTPGAELSHVRQPICVLTVPAGGALLGQTAAGPIPLGHDGAELVGALLPAGSRLLDVLDGGFTLTVLGEDQRSLAHRFTGDRPPRSGASYPIDIDIQPIGVRTLECKLETTFDVGRRAMVAGRLVSARASGSDANPLQLPAAVLDSAPIAPLGQPAGPEASPAISLPSEEPDVRMIAVDGTRRNAVVAVALVGSPEGSTGASVYFHRGCLLGDALDNTDCSRRQHLEATLAAMRRQGCGVIVYYRDEPSHFSCCLGPARDRSSAVSTAALLAARDVLRSLDLHHPIVIRRPEDVPEWRLLAPEAAHVREPARD
jgi:GTP cyclohydrolase II/Flavin reductase like domain